MRKFLLSLVFMTSRPGPCLRKKKIHGFLTANTLMWPGAKVAFQVNNLGLVCTTALMSFGTRGWSWLQLQQSSWIFTQTLCVPNQGKHRRLSHIQFKGKHAANLFFSFLTKQKIAGFKYLLFFYFAIMPSCWVSPVHRQRVVRWIFRARANNWRAKGQERC